MTGQELFEQMCHLGGKKGLVSIEDVISFTAANRAIFEVNRLFPVTEKIQLLNYPLLPVAFYKGIREHTGGEDIQIDASGVRSLAFAVSGGGGQAQLYGITYDESGDEELSLLKEFGVQKNGETSFDPSSSFVTYRYVITDGAKDVRLIFSGNYNYMVKDLSFYGDLKSDEENDIDVYSPWVKYDLSANDYIGERFMAFASKPVKFDDVSLNSPYDYKIEGAAVYLRADKPGIYEISVMTKPEPLQNATDKVDIEPQLEDIVALRAAYYLYSVTDTEIADRCNAEYQRLLAIALANVRKVSTQSQFHNVLKGW